MSLKTDFKNDKFAGKRKYAVTENGDGTVSFDDVTEYETVGDIYGCLLYTSFMPMVSGSFVNATRAASAAVQGSGEVYAAYGPQGRFLYEGKTMVSPSTGSTWAKKGEKKVLVSQYGGKTNAKENLTYTQQVHSQAQSHWFDAAKKKDGQTWIKNVKKTAGGGERG